jgi:hypothetical protein
MFVRKEMTKKIRKTRPTMARLRCMRVPPGGWQSGGVRLHPFRIVPRTQGFAVTLSAFATSARNESKSGGLPRARTKARRLRVELR